MKNLFFDFIKPYLKFIDSGDFFRKPFIWLYASFGILNLFFPFYVFYTAYNSQIFDYNSNFITVFFITLIIISFSSWISFQLFWDRKNKVKQTSNEGDEFIATPVFSHFIQTIGEWLGTWIGIVGSSVALIATILLGDQAEFVTYQFGIPFLKIGLTFVVLMPIYGFLIIVFTRFLAEQFKALSSIANNTRKK